MKKFVIALLSLCASVFAHASLGLADQTQLMVTDPSGNVLLGYGVVEAGELRLELSSAEATEVALVFVTPSATLVTLTGVLQPDGSVRVISDAGELALEEWLAFENLSLAVTVAAVEAPPEEVDDDVLERVGEPAPSGQQLGGSAASRPAVPVTPPTGAPVPPAGEAAAAGATGGTAAGAEGDRGDDAGGVQDGAQDEQGQDDQGGVTAPSEPDTGDDVTEPGETEPNPGEPGTGLSLIHI